MFHSSVRSKFRNLSREMMSPPEATRVSAPSTTCHPDRTESCLKPRHPAVVLPSNNRRQPAERSAAVSVLSAAGLFAIPACWAGLGRGATIRAAAAQAASSGMRVTGVTGFTSPPGSWREWGRQQYAASARAGRCTPATVSIGNSGQLFDSRLHDATSALALGNDEDGVVARNRADDLRPPGGVDGEAEPLSAACGRLDHEQRTNPIDRNQHRGEQLPEVRPDDRPGLWWRRVVRPAV